MSNPKKALGTSLENRVVRKAKAAGLDAKKQPGSGVYHDFPADVVIESTLVECKVRAVERRVSGERYIQLDLAWMDQVVQQAEKAGYEMGVAVFQPKNGRKQYVLIQFEAFLSLLSHPTQ
jgi:Holliday junction resolvase